MPNPHFFMDTDFELFEKLVHSDEHIPEQIQVRREQIPLLQHLAQHQGFTLTADEDKNEETDEDENNKSDDNDDTQEDVDFVADLLDPLPLIPFHIFPVTHANQNFL